MIIKAFKSGISKAWRYRRVVLVVYVTTLMLASLVALPFKGLLENKAGNSLIVSDLVKGFDYTFLNDFFQNYGEGFLPLWDQSILLVGFHFVFMIFLMGGIVKLVVVAPEKYDRLLFWGASGQYFWRLFRTTVYFLIIHGLILAFFVYLFLVITKGMSPEKLDSELIIVDTLKGLAPFYFFIGAFFFMWQDYTKIFIIEENRRFTTRPTLNALRFIMKNFRKSYGLYLLNILLLVLLIIGNHFLSCFLFVDSLKGIILAFVLSQVFIIGRLVLKLTRLGSEASLIKNKI